MRAAGNQKRHAVRTRVIATVRDCLSVENHGFRRGCCAVQNNFLGGPPGLKSIFSHRARDAHGAAGNLATVIHP